MGCSAPYIVGPYLLKRYKKVLYDLARSRRIGDRRIAMVATWWFIRQGQIRDSLKIARILLRDEEDLIHKATGWMLREVGKRDVGALEKFLKRHHAEMPRTMFRYAIERFTPAKKAGLSNREIPLTILPDRRIQALTGSLPPGSIGMLRIRLPVAVKIALPTAGARPTMGVSPAPADGMSLLSTSTTSMLGTSLNRGTRYFENRGFRMRPFSNSMASNIAPPMPMMFAPQSDFASPSGLTIAPHSNA